MVVTGEPQCVPIKARELEIGMLVPVHRLVDGQDRIVASRVVAVAQSWDLTTVYWQLEGDDQDWCWAAASEEYVLIVICCS